MRPSWFVVLLSLSFAIGLLGCDTTATQPEPQVAVEAYLQAQAPFPAVKLTRTVEATEAFEPGETAVGGGEIKIQRLDESGESVETTDYEETNTAGVYEPDVSSPVSSPIVEPETTYRLTVELGEEGSITSTTTVPDTLSLLEVANTTAEMTAQYQSEAQQPAFTIDPPRPLSDRQNVYLFTVTSRPSGENLVADDLTPVYCDGYDPAEDSLKSLRVSSSGLLNEANFSENDDGTLTVDLPWIGVAFFGPNEVAINVVDDNYYDFLRSTSAQNTAPPGEFPNIIEHVDGGTGIFGSYAQATVTIDFTRGDQYEEYLCVP